MAPKIVRTVKEMRALVDGARAKGLRVGFVPTMGFLHDGHLSLMRDAKERADVSVASIFVNPTQFGPKEDLSRYPRDLDGDLEKCGRAGVDRVFVPEVAEIYPDGFQTFVEVGELQKGLCGARRPGHFRGVATVVTKLFAIVRPDVALFGEKDFQQLQVIMALARDLNLGVEVIGRPTVRESDGLAMSSRNAYLAADERQRALGLSRGLFAAVSLAASGEKRAAPILERVRRELSAVNAREDYVELVDAKTLRPIERIAPGVPARLLVAAFMGNTRLIDNVAIE